MKMRGIISGSKCAKRAAGFTMVEIAIALGVIAFALIAIIGILPTGLQTHRDVREETIVNQDARLLIEAIRTGDRDRSSPIGAFVVSTNGVAVPSAGIATSDLIALLSEPVSTNVLVMSSITGAIANRGSDLGFRYQLISSVTDATDFSNTLLSNQVFEVRLRFGWPVLPNGTVGSQANRYVARALVSGSYSHTNGFLYAQQYWNPADPKNEP